MIVRLPQGGAVSYEPAPGSAAAISPFDSIFHNVDYNGGSVMSSNTNYVLYWDPAGAPAYPADYQPGLDRFFEDLAHDSGGDENADSVATQYNDASGAHASYDSRFAGALLDTDPYPANGCQLKGVSICLADYQIRAELAAYLKARGLPLDLQHEYFVLTPPGVESCFGASSSYCSAGVADPAREAERESYCAYHGSEQIFATGVIVYADDPYVAGGICDDGNHPNASTADATISGGLSHEHNESLTDPEPNRSWWDWSSGASTGYEIGDKCRTFNAETEFGPPLGLAPDGARYNQLINGHEYWFQQEWSNRGHDCLQRLAPGGEEAKAAFTFQTGEHEVKLDASESTAPGGVAYYDWQLNEYEGQPPLQSTSPKLEWGNATGVLRVALTVFAPDGTSNGTMHLVEVGNGAVPSIAGVSPSGGPISGGTKVTITGADLNGGLSGVRFGSVAAAAYTEESPTRMTAVAPAHGAATVDITATGQYGTSAISPADRYTFAAIVPAISGLSPDSGPRAGGTALTVTGEGFALGSKGTKFKVGKGKATAVSCSSTTTCTLITPRAKVAGTVDVVASVKKVSSAVTPGDRYTFN